MKSTKYLFVGILLASPIFLNAQSLLGGWAFEGKDQAGKAATHTVNFNADGNLTVDFSSDGTIDVESTYTMDGDVISMSDISEDSPCYGKIGKYRMVVEGDKIIASLVDDPCDARRGDGSEMIMIRL